MSYEKRRRFLWAVFLIGLALLGAAMIAVVAEATTLSRLTFGQLVEHSTSIARVRCLRTDVRQENGEIWTDTTFQVVRQYKGFLPSPIVVRMPGGKLQHIVSHVDGVPRFLPGEEVYLFLISQPGKPFRIVGWSQGTFRIHKNARAETEIVTQDSANLPVFDPHTNSFVIDGVRELSMGRFLEKLAKELHPESP
jgi:hypothetical protein